MTELEELSLELLRIESPIGAEGAIADHVEAWLAGVGVHQLVRAGDNVACLPHAFREGHARVLLLGHLDTVPASDANPPRIEGERIHGLGATDMKCADAILLDLARRAAREAPRHDLAIVLYAREEGPYSESGMLEIVPAASACFEGIDLAIAMEPTDNRAELGCLGTLHARVRFQGKRAHSGRPWQGENALHMAGPLLVALGQLAPRVVDYDGLRFRETASATMVDYDGARNVVPETCTLNVNFRYGPDRSPDEAERWIRDFVTAHVDPDLTARGLVTVEIPDLCPAGRVCHTNPLLAELRDEATRTGQPLEIAAKEAWTDVGRLSHMGIDGLNLGPGATDQAHKRGEWCDRAALERAHALLELALAAAMNALGLDALLTAAVLVAFFTVLATQRMAADTASLAALAGLLFFGVLEPGEAVAGFSNPGMITVGLLYVVARGLRETGAMISLIRPWLGRPQSTTQAQIRLLVPVAGLSAFVNNTPIVAVFLPILSGWARRHDLDASKLYMPLSFAAILGGYCTLIGTSTNVIVNGLLVEHAPGQGMGMFTLAGIGLPAALAGMLYLLVASRWLPTRLTPDAQPEEGREFSLWMRVQEASPIVGRTIEEAGLRHLGGLFLADIEREGERIVAVSPERVLRAEDRLHFVGIAQAVVELQEIRGLVPDTNQIHKLDGARTDRRMVEAVVSPSSPLIGQSVRDSGFRGRYNAVIVAVHRAGERLKVKIGDVVLRAGDTLLLEATPAFLEQQRDSSAFVLVSELADTASLRWERAPWSLLLLVALVVGVTAGWVDTMTASLCVAVAMVLTRCLTGAQARAAIDWQVLVVIGSSFGLAAAMEKTGLAAAIADIVLGATSGYGAYASLTAIFALTTVFTALLTNNSAAVLMFPIGFSIATAQGLSPLCAAATIAIGASSAFLTPLGYQTNLMVMGPGGYRWSDFARIGFPLTILVGVITVALAPLVYP